MRKLQTYLQVRKLARPIPKLCAAEGCALFCEYMVRYRSGFDAYRHQAKRKLVCSRHLDNREFA